MSPPRAARCRSVSDRNARTHRPVAAWTMAMNWSATASWKRRRMICTSSASPRPIRICSARVNVSSISDHQDVAVLEDAHMTRRLAIVLAVYSLDVAGDRGGVRHQRASPSCTDHDASATGDATGRRSSGERFEPGTRVACPVADGTERKPRGANVGSRRRLICAAQSRSVTAVSATGVLWHARRAWSRCEFQVTDSVSPGVRGHMSSSREPA